MDLHLKPRTLRYYCLLPFLGITWQKVRREGSRLPAANRVWLVDGERGLVRDPVSLPTLRAGVDELVRLIGMCGVAEEPLIALEATGSLHRAWTAELERRFPGRVRLLAPSKTQAARTQLGARRFKSDDRDCAALVWLARQGLGRKPDEPTLEALLGTVRHRRQLVAELKVLRQRLHDQLNPWGT